MQHIKTNKIRIVGGRWRSRAVPFPNTPGLRPTSDRTRETLFNWLAPHINDSTCLDLFSGSGALTFEALSRGARKVICVDEHREVIQSITDTANQFNIDSAQLEIIQASIPKFCITENIDIAFLDPPFNSDLLQTSIDWLVKQACLNDNAFIYLESQEVLGKLVLPEHWTIQKEKKAGNVHYGLAQRVTGSLPF